VYVQSGSTERQQIGDVSDRIVPIVLPNVAAPVDQTNVEGTSNAADERSAINQPIMNKPSEGAKTTARTEMSEESHLFLLNFLRNPEVPRGVQCFML
jgi:hypothetical protein